MMNNEIKQIVFDEERTKKLVRMAKIRSTIKIISISTIVTLVIIVLGLYGLRQLSLNNAQKVMNEIVMYNEISAPNVHISNQQVEYHLFGGTVLANTYKVLGNRPFVWEPMLGRYNLFGKYSPLYGSYGSIQLDGSDSLNKTNQLELFNPYTGEREMFFYHPKISYDKLKDSVLELNQLEEDLLVELAISFDQSYSLEEIKNKLPSNVQVVWWWVDTFQEERLKFMQEFQGTVRANSPFIYGFHSEHSKPKSQQSEHDSIEESEKFIENIMRLRDGKNFKWEIEQVYEFLKGTNETLNKEDVKIIGAVVTGTAKQLKELNNQSYIRGSTFGVIADLK